MKLMHAIATLTMVALPMSSSVADIVHYGDFAGDTVQFKSVRENNNTAPIFGAPTISGDQLTFGMTGASSSSSMGAADFQTGQLRFELQAAAGYQIDTISFSEFGTFFSFGANSSALAGLVSSATVDGQVYSGSSLFSANSGTGPWAEDFTLHLPGAQNVSVVVDSQLFTTADLLGAAFVDKQGLMIGAGTSFTAVPEPSSLMLVGSAASVLVLSRRRRKSRPDEVYGSN